MVLVRLGELVAAVGQQRVELVLPHLGGVVLPERLVQLRLDLGERGDGGDGGVALVGGGSLAISSAHSFSRPSSRANRATSRTTVLGGGLIAVHDVFRRAAKRSLTFRIGELGDFSSRVTLNQDFGAHIELAPLVVGTIPWCLS